MTTPPPGPQAVIEQARAQLLGGRGPGATEQEITRHTRARTWLGGQLTAQRRERLAEHTALAREMKPPGSGDPKRAGLCAPPYAK